MTSRKLMNIDQSYIRAFVGQTIHEVACGYRNALPKTCLALLLCTLNSKKHNVDQLRRWLSDHGLKRSGIKPRCYKDISIMKLSTRLRSHAWHCDSDGQRRCQTVVMLSTRYSIVVGLLVLD